MRQQDQLGAETPNAGPVKDRRSGMPRNGLGTQYQPLDWNVPQAPHGSPYMLLM